MLRVSRGRAVAAALVVGLIALCCWSLYSWQRDTKDRIDLHDLTMSLPWEKDELLVPDVIAQEGDAMGWASRGEFSVTYRVGPETGRGPVIEYAIHDLTNGDDFEWVVGCGAKVVRTCTSLGNGLTEVVTHDTDNSDPSLAVVQEQGDRLVSVTGSGHTTTDQLRQVLAQTHRPTDAELLELLRPDGYQTDWS